MADQPPQDRPPAETKRRKDGTFAPGGPSANPGGVPKWRREIEAMLDAEHRTPEQMRETFALIRKVAHGVDEPVFYRGEIVGQVRKYDGAWMNLYLERVVGPVRALDYDLTDAPQEVVAWLAENVN